LIEVRNVIKKYGDKTATNNISFKVEKGEIVGLLGPNGAGKSTIMKIITGFIPPTSGEVFVDGHDVINNPTNAINKIGFLPEIPPLYTEMRVSDYLMFMADIKSVPKAGRKEHVDEIMQMADIAHVSKRLIKNLSKGYRQRVGLAGALLSLPPILILDEPTVGLDPKQRTELRQLILKLSKNHTIILSSHILAEVSMICEKIIIMNEGDIVAIDKTSSLEKDIEASDKFDMRIKGDEQSAIDILKSLGCVINSSSSTDDKIVSLCASKLKLDKKSDDLRQDIFYEFAKAKMPILEMRTIGMTLEEIFLQLTNQNVKEGGK